MSRLDGTGIFYLLVCLKYYFFTIKLNYIACSLLTARLQTLNEDLLYSSILNKNPENAL